MAKNKLTDLNNHLFAQLERLGDENIKDDDMDLEIRKSKAIAQISGEILKNAKLILDASKLVSAGALSKAPEQFGTPQIGNKP